MASQFIFPKPKSWDTFEDIVCDVFSRKLNNRNFQRYGRSGQLQFGVDIVGVVNNSVVGIQCKHYPNGKVSNKDVNEEIRKAEKFKPHLTEYIITTSSDRDAKIISHVLKLSQRRKDSNKFPVSILFWDDIYGRLSEFPDLLYKYFTKYFPQAELETLKGLQAERNKLTINWPASEDSLLTNVNKSLGEIIKTDPYKVTLGVTTFDEIKFNGVVDLEISLASCVSNNVPEDGFVDAAKILREVKGFLQRPYYSKELFVHMNLRLPYAFLFGWTFRKVTGYEFKMFSSDQVWTTGGLPLVFTHLQESPPQKFDWDVNDLVFVVNISRDISNQVDDFVQKWRDKPKAILSYSYQTSSNISPALAISMALEISQRIKSFKDNWGARRIHLFGAMPAPLAALIGYNLNSICPISIYYMDQSDNSFRIGGTLTNDV